MKCFPARTGRKLLLTCERLDLLRRRFIRTQHANAIAGKMDEHEDVRQTEVLRGQVSRGDIYPYPKNVIEHNGRKEHLA